MSKLMYFISESDTYLDEFGGLNSYPVIIDYPGVLACAEQYKTENGETVYLVEVEEDYIDNLCLYFEQVN